MEDRDLNIQQIRPQIDFGEIHQPLDRFQEVLRQVLKFQNDILVQLSIHFLEKKYKSFATRDETIKKDLFYQSLKKDIPFKKELIGVLNGLFTKPEMDFYLANRQEINKRLVEFIYKRLVAQIL
ncbi:hypothetical protein [Pedobacter arcticus]|uniref:hypothetical protein n=1 Tax=Pedobacter arcticus TaxID=752140 RepID=UPI0002EBC845|nr:hypothetical protein [Pedobacter arcticus]